MSHINYPTDFTGQMVLFLAIKKKVDKDGDDSPLKDMLLHNEIDLEKDALDCVKATEYNTLFLAAKKNSEDLLEKRNLLMKPIMKHLRGAFQFLKKYYSTNYKEIVAWGGTITISGKISYVSGTQNRVQILTQLKKRSDSYIDLSNPLLPFLTQNKINLETDASNGALAVIRHDDFKDAKSQAAVFSGKRDKKFAKSLTDTYTIGASLMALSPENTKSLCDYGFDIVTTVKIVKERIIELGIGKNRLAFRAKVGSVISNLGTKDLNVYKGKLIVGIPLLLKAGADLILTKGYSIFSVSNPSGTDFGTFLFSPV